MIAYKIGKHNSLNSIQTPPYVAFWIKNLIETFLPKKMVILDPAVGQGNLLAPWEQDHYVHGNDIAPTACYHQSDFLKQKPWRRKYDLILCNPPFTNSRQHHPFLFFQRINDLFPGVPLVFFVPMGFRLNVRSNTTRRKILAAGPEIKSIISCPLDFYGADGYQKVLFHNEILIYNIEGLKPHYWLPELTPSNKEYMEYMKYQENGQWTEEGKAWLKRKKFDTRRFE
jgi:hypothetical protein